MVNGTTNEINKILFGGAILTINSNQPYIEAVGIKGDKIASAGSLEEC